MGKQDKGWMPPDEDVEEVQTTPVDEPKPKAKTDTVQAWSPPEEDAQPVKKKDSSVRSSATTSPADGPLAKPNSPSGNASFVDAELLKKSSAKPTPTDKDDAREFLRDVDRKNNQGHQYREQNPFVSMGTKAWQAVAYDMPAQLAAASSLLLTAKNPRMLYNPDVSYEEEQKAVAVAKGQVLDWAGKRQGEGRELSKDIVDSISEIEDPIDAVNWTFGAVGNAVGTIPLAAATGGSTAIGQEIGSIYMDGVQKVADEKGLTTQQVIEQGLDNPAIAVSYGFVAGAFERVGAGKVMQGLTRDAMAKSLRGRALAVLEAGVTEGATEYAQTYLEQLGASQVAGKTFGEAWAEAQTSEAARERLEAAAQGAVGGGGISSIIQTMSPREATAVATENLDVRDQTALDNRAEAIQEKVDSQESEVALGETDVKPVSIDEVRAETTAAVEEEASGIVEEGGAGAVPETQTKEEAPKEVQAEAVVEETVDLGKAAARKEIDKLVESKDVARDEKGRVTVLTEKGGKELRRILEETKIPYKRSGVEYEDRPAPAPSEDEAKTLYIDDPNVESDAVSERKSAEVPLGERTRSGQEVGKGDAEGQVAQEGQSVQEEIQSESEGDAGTVRQSDELNKQVDGTDESATGTDGTDAPSNTGTERPLGENVPDTAPRARGAEPQQKELYQGGQEPARTANERKTWSRIKDDPDVSVEIKDAIAKEAKEYVPRSLRKVTQHEADVIIDWMGNDLATKMYLDDNTGIHHDVDTALGIRLFEKLQKEGEYGDAVRVFEKLAKKGTELGQAVNAYKLLQGKTMLFVVDRALKRSRKKYKEMNVSKGIDAKKAIDDINQNAINQVLLSPQVETAKKSRATSVKKAVDFLESLKVDTKGKALDIAFGITAAAWNTVITAVQKGLQAGLTITQAIDRAVSKVNDKNFQKKEAIEYLDQKLATYRVTLDPEKAIRAELKAQGSSLDDIIRSHYTQQASTKKGLVDKLIKDGNVDPDQAQEIADAISVKFDDLTRKAKESALNKIIPKPKKVTPKNRKDTIDRLIEQSNMGALSEDQYLNTIAEQIGVPSLDAAQAQDIQALTDAIQNAKGDTQRSKAAQNLYNYIEGLNGWTWLEAVESVWFANMLSGPTTWLVTNPFANATNLFSEAAIDIARNPTHAPFILSRIAAGLTRGLIQAGDVLRTGYDPYKGENYKTEAKPLLERVEFKGGKVNPINWLKYVTRAIKAGDVIFYQGLKEQRYAILALNEAQKNGRKKPNKQDMASLYGKLMAGNYESALSEAESEGLTGTDAKLRAYEIMEEKLPEMDIKEAENFAARATFNMKPEGVLGAMATWINTGRRELPVLKVVVPFVNTIINVANEYLNYNPVVGAWRVASGSMGFKTWGSTYRRFTNEERARIAIKTMIGTVAVAALATLDDEEKDGKIEITSDGTGDIKKNYELQRQGWRPYSIRIGDTWYAYKNTPLAMPLAMVGFWKDAGRYGADPDRTKKIEIAMMGSWKVFQDMSTLSGLADFFELMNKDSLADLEKGAKGLFKYLERSAKAVVVPNYFTQMSRLVQEMTDTPMKKAVDPGEAIIRDMPVLRDHMDNMYDAFGDPVVAKQMERFLPFNASRSPEDKEMFEFLSEHKLFVGVAAKSNMKPNGEGMTDEEYNAFALESAKRIKKRVQKEYKRYSKEKNGDKVAEWFSDLKREERRAAKIKLFGLR